MGFFAKLFAKRPKIRTEYTGEPFEVSLYPLEGFQAERESLLEGDRRRRWVWADLSARDTGGGKITLTVRVNGVTVGEIPHRYRNTRNNASALQAVRGGVDVATVCISRYDGIDGGTTALLKFGEHKYMPKRTHEVSTVE